MPRTESFLTKPFWRDFHDPILIQTERTFRNIVKEFLLERHGHFSYATKFWTRIFSDNRLLRGSCIIDEFRSEERRVGKECRP